MGSWISKAKNVFRREEPRAPQPFELHCECGQEHTGVRRGRHQHIVCKTCGASLFVLPRDVYPPPHPSARRRRRSSSDDPPLDPLAESGELKLAEPSAGDSPSAPMPSVRFEPKEPKKSKAGSIRRRRRRDEDDDDEDDEFELPREPGLLARAARRVGLAITGALLAVRTFFVEGFRAFVGFWTPLRLTLLGVFLLIGTMAAFSIRQHLREIAGRVVREKAELATKAVDNKNWVQARRHLDEVVAALDRLGRDDAEANALRQLHRETMAMTRLCGISLFELLMTADDAVKSDGNQRWQDRFRTSYQGDWLVVEGPVVRAASAAGQDSAAGYVLQFPWRVGPRGRSVTIRADLPAFAELGVGTSPQFVVFSAPLKSCRLSSDGRRWELVLDGTSGFLWVNQQTYQALGFNFDAFRSQDELKNVFAAQARAMGVEP